MNAENIISPAELDSSTSHFSYAHHNPGNPFPELDHGQNAMIIEATKNMYYVKPEYKSKGDYFMQIAEHSFLPLEEAAIRRELGRNPGINKERIRKTDGTTLSNSMIDYCLIYLAKYKQLESVYRLISGHRAGIDPNTKTLYLKEQKLITPKKGDFTTIAALLKSITTEPGKIPDADESAAISRLQYDYLIAWCAHAVKTLYAHQFDPGALLLFVGAPDTGKSFLIKSIFAPMLATPHPADCSQYLAEGKFNADWAHCALLTADDKGTFFKVSTRRQASEHLKALLAPVPHAITGKGANTYYDYIFWRFIICANPTYLDKIILEVNSSTADKIAAIYCNRINVPGYPNKTQEERAELEQAISSELPAFIHYLLHEYINPSPATRYGAAVYRHPKLDEVLRQGSTAFEVLDFICTCIYEDNSDTASHLDTVFTNVSARYIKKTINEIIQARLMKVTYPPCLGSLSALKTTLERLADEAPHFVSMSYNSTKKTNMFTINFAALKTRYE